jgi:hypothetical protein
LQHLAGDVNCLFWAGASIMALCRDLSAAIRLCQAFENP